MMVMMMMRISARMRILVFMRRCLRLERGKVYMMNFIENATNNVNYFLKSPF